MKERFEIELHSGIILSDEGYKHGPRSVELSLNDVPSPTESITLTKEGLTKLWDAIHKMLTHIEETL